MDYLDRNDIRRAKMELDREQRDQENAEWDLRTREVVVMESIAAQLARIADALEWQKEQQEIDQQREQTRMTQDEWRSLDDDD